MENWKKKRLFCLHSHHTYLSMPHIKQACLQITDYKSQTTTNCNPETHIRTCIRMVKKRTNGAWLFQLTTATQCLQKDLTKCYINVCSEMLCCKITFLAGSIHPLWCCSKKNITANLLTFFPPPCSMHHIVMYFRVKYRLFFPHQIFECLKRF